METKNKLLEVKDLSIHYFTDEGVVRAVKRWDWSVKPVQVKPPRHAASWAWFPTLRGVL